jgi:hypothetical protein
MDLHLHTPASADFKDRGATYLQWLQKAEARGLDIVALTDHNSVAGWASLYREVETLIALDKRARLTEDEKHTLGEYRRLADKLLVLPGFEVTATLGFHVLGIFPMGTTVRRLEHILLDLNIPEDKLEQGVGEVGSTSDVLTVYREIADNGGIAIAAHANSTHGVALQGFDFGGQTKIAYTQDRNLHAMEVTDLESTSRRRTANFFNGSKPEYPRQLHCIQGSDAHRLDHDPRDKSEPWGIGDRVTEVYLPEPTFAALKELFLSTDFARTRPARPWGGPVQQPAFDEIKAARQQGPNLVQSFHEHFAASKPGRLAAVVADVVAMANTNGGAVYLGVNASPKPAVAGVERPEEAVAMIKAELQKATTPAIGAVIDIVQSEGKPVVVIKVPKGLQTPYVLGTGQIHVRQESETTLAMRDEIIRLVLASHAPGAAAAVAAAQLAEHPAGEVPLAAPQPVLQPAARPIPQPLPQPAPQTTQQKVAPLPTRMPAVSRRQPPPTPRLRPMVTPAVAAPPAPVAAPVNVPLATPVAATVAAPIAPPVPEPARPVEVVAAAPAPETPATPAPAARPRRRVARPATTVAPAPTPGTAPVAMAPVPSPAAPPVVAVPAAAAVQSQPAPAAAPGGSPRRRTRKAAVKPAPEVAAPAVVAVAPGGAPVVVAPVEVLPAAEAAAAPGGVSVPGGIAPKPRRRRAAKSPPVAAEAPAAASAPEASAPDAAVPAAPEEPTLSAEPPRTGVEILAVENRDGVLTYTVRDLRNGNVVHNVTRFSARHLWKYAITEREDNPLDQSRVTWQGPLGLWKTYKRAGARRYNLLQRDSQGDLHVYYGVTEDGIHGEWRAFLDSEQ